MFLIRRSVWFIYIKPPNLSIISVLKNKDLWWWCFEFRINFITLIHCRHSESVLRRTMYWKIAMSFLYEHKSNADSHPNERSLRLFFLYEFNVQCDTTHLPIPRLLTNVADKLLTERWQKYIASGINSQSYVLLIRTLIAQCCERFL